MNITVIVSKALNKENWKKGVNYLNKVLYSGIVILISGSYSNL